MAGKRPQSGHVAAAWLRARAPLNDGNSRQRRWIGVEDGCRRLHATLAAHDCTVEAALSSGKSDHLGK